MEKLKMGEKRETGSDLSILMEKRVELEREDLLKAIETAREAMNITSPEGIITYTNPAMDDLFGYERGELIGKSPSILNAGPEPVTVMRDIMRSIEKRDIWGGEIHNKRKDGTEFTSYARISAVKDKKGEIINFVSTQHDITERKQMIEGLRKSKRQASAAIEAARALTFNYDLASGKVEWGGAIEDITGYTAEEFANIDVDGWVERIHPDDRVRILSILQEAMGKDRATAEYRFKTKKGYITLSSISITEKQDGKVVRLVGISQDITERKRAEEALEDANEKWTSLTKNTNDIVMVVERNGIIQYINRTISPYTIKETIGTTIYKYVPAEHRKIMKESITKVFKTGIPDSYEVSSNIPRIGTIWFNTKVVPIKRRKKVANVILISADITERKRVEEELQKAYKRSRQEEEAIMNLAEDLEAEIDEHKRAEEEIRKLNEELELKVKDRTEKLRKERDYTRHLIETSPDFQFTLDKNGMILDVNEAFEEIMGIVRGELVGSSIYRYLPKGDIERIISVVQERKKVKNIELAAEVLGKGRRILNISGTVCTAEEGEECLYFTARDMTELREKETQLIHAGRLSSLGEMATGVAHEISQPLAVISLAAECTLRDIEKKRFDVNALSNALEDIMGHVKRIDRIITHMRTFAGRQEEKKWVKPEAVLNNAFMLLSEQFKNHDISFSRKIEDNLPLIETDENQLEQVFVNIMINARQALDEWEEEARKKGVDFEKRLVCGISRQNNNIICEFADNAFGVPDKLKMRVFEPFFTTKEAGEGTGLGLSIAYSIVTRSLRGKIWVEDNDMGGASFKVAIPVEDKEEEKGGGR